VTGARQADWAGGAEEDEMLDPLFNAPLEEKLAAGKALLLDQYEEHKPSHVFALFSGGHDSLTCTAFAAEALGDKLDGVVHVDTGMGIPATREFVRNTCERFGWRLLVYKATENTLADGTPDPMVYEEIVKKYGFPGPTPAGHTAMFVKLKGRQFARLMRGHRDGNRKVMLIAGVRKQESDRRKINTGKVTIAGRQLWVAPFYWMKKLDCTDFILSRNLPRNPVVDALHMSGECLCGAYCKGKEERDEIRLWYPEVAAEIDRIEVEVRRAGHNWSWHEGPPQDRAAPTGDLFEDDFEMVLMERLVCGTCAPPVDAQ
jgi:3'-phosphoadenosine 5'-phosphosulfate sulfotransferase (PAPS reductase)/FAD synthetase